MMVKSLVIVNIIAGTIFTVNTYLQSSIDCKLKLTENLSLSVDGLGKHRATSIVKRKKNLRNNMAWVAVIVLHNVYPNQLLIQNMPLLAELHISHQQKKAVKS